MGPLADAFARALVERGVFCLWIGPLAFMIAVPCALALKRRGKLYWTTTSVMLASLAFIGLGLLNPMVFIGALAIPVVSLAAIVTLVAPLWALYWLIASRRPQHVLEALYVVCASSTVAAAAVLVIAASATV
jgi:hypothetical protein